MDDSRYFPTGFTILLNSSDNYDDKTDRIRDRHRILRATRSVSKTAVMEAMNPETYGYDRVPPAETRVDAAKQTTEMFDAFIHALMAIGFEEIKFNIVITTPKIASPMPVTFV